MDILKEQYKEILQKREKITKQINILKNTDTVKKYFELCNQNDQLTSQSQELYKQLKIQEYKSCNHIWVTTLREHDSYEGRTYKYCGCIKCGLDERLLIQGHNYRQFSLEQQIIYNFMKEHTNYNGTYTNISCDLDLAQAIYKKIKKAHPNIDDKTALKYFETSLNDIREIKVNETRKINRAKRLSLSPKFNSWNKYDI